MNGFEFMEADGWTFLQHTGLTAAGVVHGFMLKGSGRIVSDPVAERNFLSALAGAACIALNQVHGDTVHVVRDGERPKEGDGLIVFERAVAAVVKTADCLPVLLHAPDIRCVAAIHAGWRGTARKIVEQAVSTMVSLGAAPGRVVALLGPGIGPCCYEVRDDVRHVFQEAGFDDGVFQRRGERFFLDLKGANRLELERLGVLEVHDVGVCTYCRQDLFHSARRDGDGGRQINFVMLKG